MVKELKLKINFENPKNLKIKFRIIISSMSIPITKKKDTSIHTKHETETGCMTQLLDTTATQRSRHTHSAQIHSSVLEG